MTGDEASLLGFIFGTVTCTKVSVCTSSREEFQDFDSYGGILLWFAICIYMFKQLGTICDEYFVPSLEVIVEKLEMSNDVAGATFMAAGSSAPELFTSLVATFFIVNEGGVGTIVGSAIFNILVIVGATGYIACKDNALDIWWYPLTRDCVFYCISITELMYFLSDDEIMWYESSIMVLTYLSYIAYMWKNPSIVAYFGFGLPEEAEEETDSPQREVSCHSERSIIQSGWETDPAQREVSCHSESDPSKRPSEGEQNGSAASWQDPVTEVKLFQKTESDRAIKPVRFEAEVEVQEFNSTEFEKETADAVVAKVVVGELPNKVPDSEGEDGEARTEEVSEDGEARTRQVTEESKPGLYASKSTVSSAAKKKERIRMSMRGVTSELNLKSVLPGSEDSDGIIRSETEDGNPSYEKPPRSQSCMVQVGTIRDMEEAEEEEAPGSSGPGRGVHFRWQKFIRDPLSLALETLMPSPERHWLLFSLSILCIGMSTYVMVDSVNRAGTILRVPPMVMGLTVLAAGTSIPDAMGSIAVAKQGEGDMAVANALGSNIFDILVGLGVPWTIRCAMGNRVTFPGKFALMHGDIIILVCVLLLFVGSLLLNRWRLTRRVGILLIVFYFLNVLYNILAVYVFKTKVT